MIPVTNTCKMHLLFFLQFLCMVLTFSIEDSQRFVYLAQCWFTTTLKRSENTKTSLMIAKVRV